MSRHNVLLVVADSLRARSTSVLGYRRETTPFLDAFAEEATVYTQARSPSNWTVPSHVSMFTGHEAHEHGVDHTARLDAGHTIFEELAAAGYDTGLFSDNPFLTDHESGLDDVFQTAVGSPEQYDSAYETNGSLGDWPNGFWYADRTLEWVDDRESEWAACINLMDTHRPYEPLAEYDEWSDERSRDMQESMGFKWHWEFLSGNLSLGFASILEQIYDGAVRQADAIFETLIRGLDERGVLDDTLVVFVGDHGEGFGEPTAIPEEPPAVSHRIGTHDTMYHAPLVVRAPGQREGHRVTDLATLSRFPDAVRAMALGDGNADGPAFASPNGTVVASQAPIGPAMREEAERVCGDAAPFAKHARLVYHDRPGDEVRKRAAWGDSAHESVIKGCGGTAEDSDIDATVVRNHFDSERYADVDIATPLDGYTEFEDASETQFAGDLDDRLEALGYK
ncbi:sulfatase [Haloarcula sp. H-GB5]